jgi:hypothetical protein
VRGGDRPSAPEGIMDKIESLAFSAVLAICGAFTLIVVPFA